MQVVYNNQDRDYSLEKIEALIENASGMEILLVVLADTVTAFPANPNPAAPLSIAASVGQGVDNRPARGPYLGHWPFGSEYEDVEWYPLHWNEGITLTFAPLDFPFNYILEKLI
jgi:hypothetical protein